MVNNNPRNDDYNFRLNFAKFVISGPSTAYPGDGDPNSRGSCIQARFTAENEGPSPPVICGTNTGYHMILEAREEPSCNKLTFSWESSGLEPEWNIQVMQISCSAHWKPAPGCLQYFTGNTGVLYSYNYGGSLHLTNQQYDHCIRTEEGHCSISYSSLSTTSFQVSEIAPSTSAAIAVIGESCSQDWITIPGGGQTSGASTSSDRQSGPASHWSRSLQILRSDWLKLSSLLCHKDTRLPNPPTSISCLFLCLCGIRVGLGSMQGKDPLKALASAI